MSNKERLKSYFWSFFDQLLTFQCPLCEQSAHRGLLCPLCRTFLDSLEDACPTCGAPETLDLQCGRCQKRPPPWQRARVGWPLEGATRFLIHRMKYSRDYAAARSLAYLWPRHPLNASDVHALVPVPQHPSKLRERGFNQAEWLADYWSKRSRIPLWRGVTKTIATTPLEGLNRAQRRQALKGVFEVTGEPPKRLAIVDDVLTTGATAAELSRVLKKAGAEYIEIWALARTPLNQ